LKNVGRIGWIDLTVADAGGVKDFYEKVVGWTVSPLDQGTHEDFVMNVPEDESPIAGICHALGENANLPPHWLVYVNVKSVHESLALVRSLGGQVVDGPRKLAGRDFACIRDPAGAYLGLLAAEEE
jgi:predicted enzyme related to lactoylglutathione lyase